MQGCRASVISHRAPRTVVLRAELKRWLVVMMVGFAVRALFGIATKVGFVRIAPKLAPQCSATGQLAAAAEVRNLRHSECISARVTKQGIAGRLNARKNDPGVMW